MKWSHVDNTKLYLSFKPLDADMTLASISQDLYLIPEWFCQKQLLINPDKTKVYPVWYKATIRETQQPNCFNFGSDFGGREIL